MTEPIRLLRQRLFIESDIGTKVHGWRQHGMKNMSGIRIDGFVNDIGFALMHVVNQKQEENAWKDIYDQFTLFESPGATVICTDQTGRVGLVENYRLVGPRPERIIEQCRNPETRSLELKRYVQVVRTSESFAALADSLGRYVWECPRGIAPATGVQDLQGFVRGVAAIEAKEEGGFDIADAEIVGEVNANTTFFAHNQFVVRARIVGSGDNRPEALERIGKVRLFAPSELRAMVASRDLFDGLTLASLAIAGFAF